MTDYGSVHPHLVSLENSRFLAVLRRWLGHGPWGLYRSTRFIGFGAPRRTQHQNIFGRVDIAIMAGITVRANPLANFERHGLLNSPAIRDGFTQAAISQHPFDIQILKTNYLVLVNQLRGLLVQKIPAAIRYPGMNSGHTLLLLAAAVGAFTLLAQASLRPLQLTGIAVGVFGRTRLIPIGSDNHILDAHIHADSVPSHRQGENLYLAGHADEITASRVFADRDHFGDAPHTLRPLELERTQLGQLQPLAFGVEVLFYMALIELIAHRLRLVAFLKSGILGPTGEEVFKRRILVPQFLGMATGGGFAQPRAFRLLQYRQLAAEADSVQRLALRFIRLRSRFQRPIPHIAGMAEFNGQLPLLRGRRVKPEFVGPLRYHAAIMPQLSPMAKEYSRAGQLRETRIHGETKVMWPSRSPRSKLRTLAGGSSCVHALLQC
ncbi:hypothetical protein Nhal_0233 [Nitrosococcus halophilus Nc 4]|uniref:Uncharacterized protein n=1 Tax=Nitrosococcus halophilus (strain Nc4) TaxID=472759 RepID=D5BUN6_NITHN|nr:hypothetical protein Nhal_0233 [Nitrosococcus halophilus Nc 4]